SPWTSARRRPARAPTPRTGGPWPASTTRRHEPRVTADGGVEHDPRVLLDAVATCLDAVCARAGRATILGGGLSTFWHGLCGLDAAGQAVTPVYMWADARSARDAGLLRSALDEAELHERTGCHLHSSYWPAKLRW